MPLDQNESKKAITLMVARVPEAALNELDNRIGELWREENIDHDNEELISDDMMAAFNLLTIGYDAAWTEAERLSAALEDAQQTVARQREALQAIYEESEDKGARHCAADALEIEWEGVQP